MNLADYRAYCLAKPSTTEDFPFDQQTLVFKVGGKMYALLDVDFFESVNLKCEPERAIDLRERYADIRPGYHMSKVHWNTVGTAGDVPGALLLQMTDDSYALVRASLPRKVREELG